MMELIKMAAMSLRKKNSQRGLKIEMTVCVAGFNVVEREREA